MKLNFLGQTYSASLNEIHTETSGEIGQFLGQKYQIKNSVKNYKSKLGLRKYRGVVYGG